MSISSERKLTLDQIEASFVQCCREQEKIGIEVEKIGLRADKIKAPRYRGKEGYLAILGKMYEELGWNIVEQKDHFILQMERCGASLNLESDGRIELAGTPHESMHDLAREFRIHQKEIAEISNVFGVSWLGVGYHPFSRNQDIEDVPGERKDLMAEYFQKVKDEKGNDFGLAWYKKTAGIHVNIDYKSEEDFARKTKVLTKLIPVLTAMYANSPFSKGKFTGYMGFRTNVVNKTNIPRFYFDEEIYHSEYRYKDWIEHVIKLPVLFLKKDEGWIKPNCTFEEYMENGFEGHEATMDDYDMHVKSAWKDLRTKNVIELRCIDSLPPHLVSSVPTLLKGLMYDRPTLLALEKITEKWTYREYLDLREGAAELGLQYVFRGEKLLDIARDLIDIAESALKKDRILNYFGEDESVYLQPIKELIFGFGGSPSEWLIYHWERKWRRNFHPAIQWWQY